MSSRSQRPIDVDTIAAGVLAGDRTEVARAITLVESTRTDHSELAQQLLEKILPKTGGSIRVGISGIPGAGKSTLIDALGTTLTARGHRVAVLAIDPSSKRRGGSILGDKTRMASLAVDPAAFVRPSPASGSLGGVTRSTSEALLIMEAAGYDIVIVETVGTGQSESAVANMVDSLLLLTVPGTGDSLQGIKRGVLELADIVAVNKTDGERVLEATQMARELADALHLFGPTSRNWDPPVLTCSARDGIGIDRIWDEVERHREALLSSGELETKRDQQTVESMWMLVEARIFDRVRSDPSLRDLAQTLEGQLQSRTLTAGQGAEQMLKALGHPPRHDELD